jgi:hypothetical protein
VTCQLRDRTPPLIAGYTVGDKQIQQQIDIPRKHQERSASIDWGMGIRTIVFTI